MSVNDINVSEMNKDDAKYVLREAKRPTIIVFGKPLMNSGSVLADLGIIRGKLWDTKDVHEDTLVER